MGEAIGLLRSPMRRMSSPTSSWRWPRHGGDRAAAGRAATLFVGIGGAGLSAYATSPERGVLKAAVGTRARRSSSRPRRDRSGHRRRALPPADFEAVVSTAHVGRVEGRSRRSFSAELVARRRVDRRRRRARQDDDLGDDRVRLRELGPDPRGSSVGSSPSSAAMRAWGGLAGRRGRRVGPLDRPLRPEIAVVTNVELDHHGHYASRG